MDDRHSNSYAEMVNPTEGSISSMASSVPSSYNSTKEVDESRPLRRHSSTHAMDERHNHWHAHLISPTVGSINSVASSMTKSYNSTKEVDVSSVSVASSSGSGFRKTQDAAEKLNRGLFFGESERPEDLDEDWCYVSDKNANKRQDHLTSDLATLIHLLKGNIGAGLLALPYAVSMSGYLIGPVLLLVLGVISMHCMVMLVKAAKDLCLTPPFHSFPSPLSHSFSNDTPTLDYSETMQFAILRYFREKKSKRASQLAKIGKVTVNVFLIITQFGFCAVYFVVIAENLQQVLFVAFGLNLTEKEMISIVILPVIIFSWIRDLDRLSYFSMMANIALLFSLGVIFYDEIYRLTTSNHENMAMIRTTGLPWHKGAVSVATFLGSAVYAFEGIGVVLPLENKMKLREHAPRVVYIGMSMVTGLFVAFSLMGYLVYGDATQASVTLNLCGTNVASELFFLLTKLFIAFALFCTYLLQFYVPLDFLWPIVWPIVFHKLKLDSLTYRYTCAHQHLENLAQCIFRTILVLITASLALGLPDLGDLITLVGALASSCLVFVFPPAINIFTFCKSHYAKSSLPYVFKDLCIIAIGMVGCVFGTYAAILNLVNYFKQLPQEFICTGLSS